MIDQWRSQLRGHSGNLTTNESMPEELIEKLLDEEESLQDKLEFEETVFPVLDRKLDVLKGLNIIAGLQQKTKEKCLTLFRGVRFPTFKRIHEMITERGYAISNYEQERIFALYNQPEYIEKRNAIKSDPHFWTQPQERVVPGLPVFSLVNDALQIHRAFRGIEDLAAMCVIHIPKELLSSGKVTLVANTAIDINHDTDERDFKIRDFREEDDRLKIDYSALRTRGINVHEMFTQDLPFDMKGAEKIGISQEYFLLHIARITERRGLAEIFADTKLLRGNEWFLHGFFGDQNVFGRRRSEYLPYKCESIKLKGENIAK